MGSVNKVMVLGRLGADPEVRTTNDGTKLCNLRIATSESWKDKSGNKQERTEWHRIVIWNSNNGKSGMADIAEKYLRKGSLCYVEGQSQTRKWQNSEGKDQYSTEVVLRPFNGMLQLLDKAPEPGGFEPEQSSGGFDDLDGDSVPF